jgi:hypothetical protein
MVLASSYEMKRGSPYRVARQYARVGERMQGIGVGSGNPHDSLGMGISRGGAVDTSANALANIDSKLLLSLT